MKTDNTRPFQTIAELVVLVQEFENGTLPRAEWNHRAHLAVALWYLIDLDEAAATEAMIGGIRRYNRAQGIRMTRGGGYHETLTLFWLAIARAYLADHPAGSELKRVNAFVRKYGEAKKLHLEYYSPRRIMSWTARHRWVGPDLKPLAAPT